MKMHRMTLYLVLAVLLVLLPYPSTSSAAGITVTTTADSGPGSLRDAIARAGAGDAITFDEAIFPPKAPATIYLASALPPLTQYGLAVDGSAAGVVLDGYYAPTGTNGLELRGSGIVIRGLRIQEFKGRGILIAASASGCTIGGSRAIGGGPNGQGNQIVTSGNNGIEILGSGNLVVGNDIGLKGTIPAGNTHNGIALWQGASNNTIGVNEQNLRNEIGWNGQNGIWIAGAGSTRNRVLGNNIGSTLDGSLARNGLAGVAIQAGASSNDIGGTGAGEGNTISRNADNGIYLSDAGTRLNRILGNTIGVNLTGMSGLGQGNHGILIALGASENSVGDGSSAGTNIISGNEIDGIKLSGAATAGNRIRGNRIGTDATGSYAIPNGMHGIEIAEGANGNTVGGSRLSNLGNLISGNMNHGIVLTSNAHHNTVQGNLIGPDLQGATSLGNHESGGIDLADGASNNTIGGLNPGEGNVISGNLTDGIALFVSAGVTASTDGNQILGNRIGLKLETDAPLPNGGPGILNTLGTANTRIEENQIAYNPGYGIVNSVCTGNTLHANLIFANGLGAVHDEPTCVTPATITQVQISGTETITGTALPNSNVEIYSDDDGQGRHFEGVTTASAGGVFTFAKAGGFAGSDVSALVTDAFGNSSAYSTPYHLQWTIALYFNGDNNLEEYLLDTITNTIAAAAGQIVAGHSTHANIVALVDGSVAQPDTVLIDLTGGTRSSQADYLPHEQNMGDGQTLANFLAWVKTRYPARHLLLSIADHGGGWAPSSENTVPGTQPGSRRYWMAGGSGLSWDESSDFDYLNIGELRQALNQVTRSGSEPLDVLYLDVCLMGMLEVAYELRSQADFFVSSQNIGWAPLGEESRYAKLVRELPASATPREVAALLVRLYADSLPDVRHPYTVSAVDLTQISALRSAVDNLAAALLQETTDAAGADTLAAVYRSTQKLDYDSDFALEADKDGFVDLGHFAQVASAIYAAPTVAAAAQTVQQLVATAVVSEAHRSGTPWMLDDRSWNLDHATGLSIFLPLGEDLDLPIPISDTVSGGASQLADMLTVRNLKLRDTYTATQLSFVADSSWRTLIDRYFWAAAQPVPIGTAGGPVAGLQRPDVAPPTSSITVTGDAVLGETLHITWSATDALAGVAGAALLHRVRSEPWQKVAASAASSGEFSFQINGYCTQNLAVQSYDMAGNYEAPGDSANTYTFQIDPCFHAYMPALSRNP